MLLFRILCWGGVGDTLRNLSLVPHEFIYRKFGLRSPVIVADLTRHELAAAEAAKRTYKDLVSRCSSLRWVGEVENHRGIAQVTNRALREILRICNGGVPPYFPFEIPLTDTEQAEMPPRPPGFVVGIQTHLSGMSTKLWGMDNWRWYIRQLLDARPDISVVLIDGDVRVTELGSPPRVTTTRGLNICQSIRLVEQLDFVVAIDSWTKYVALWSNIPQLIVVPDQRPDFAGLTADKLVCEEFAAILPREDVEVIGLSTSPQPRYTLAKVTDLPPSVLLERTLVRIDNVRATKGR